MKKFALTFAALAATSLLATALVTGQAFAQAKVKAGTLTCTGGAGVGLILGSKTSYSCTYKAVSGRTEKYTASVQKIGLDTGQSAGLGIVPVITGSSISAGRLADAMFKRGVNVQPIIYPAVPEKSSRLRFFVSSEHTPEHIKRTVEILSEESRRVFAEKVDLASLAIKLASLKAK